MSHESARSRTQREEAPWTRFLPALLVPVSLLTDLAAALPQRTYFFRDFTVTFLPLRLFAAQELRQGRLPFWNPYVFEGTFQLPSLYPLDLLHIVWPTPVFVSWLLTLHLPLAALGAYWLARELGVSRTGAFGTGSLFALGGLGLSCLNLYVFLQALALAPVVVGLLRRAALRGGGWRVAAGASIAFALSTLAVEFVAQGIVLGLALGLVEGGRRAIVSVGVALALGIGLAGVPVVTILAILPETARGAGFHPAASLANAVHPVVLLQTLLPHLFGFPAAPAEAWWGGRFFSKGMPYFLSLYVGPFALALGVAGWREMASRTRVTLLALGLGGLWYALGATAGLAALVLHLPLGAAFRFPSKALLLPYLALALAAGFGVERVRRDGRVLSRVAMIALGLAGLSTLVPVLMTLQAERFIAWTGIAASFWPRAVSVAARDAAVAVFVALGAVAVAVAVSRRWLRTSLATGFVLALLVADLMRGGAGVNRQVPGAFFDPLPEFSIGRATGGGRVFSYGLDHSPAFRAFLSRGGTPPMLTITSFFVDRQMRGPYTNMLDGLEATEGTDLTGFAPRQRELSPEMYDPSRFDRLVPWLQNAAVSVVLSLDPLAHRSLVPQAAVPLGAADLVVRAYRLVPRAPRAYVACRVLYEPDADKALLRPYAAGFRSNRDVALDVRGVAECRDAAAHAGRSEPGWEQFETAGDGPGYLVVRGSYARGWSATVDGNRVPVLRANGKHKAVPVPAGRHSIVLRYRPPGLALGVALSGLSLVGCVVLLSWQCVRPRRARA